MQKSITIAGLATVASLAVAATATTAGATPTAGPSATTGATATPSVSASPSRSSATPSAGSGAAATPTATADAGTSAITALATRLNLGAPTGPVTPFRGGLSQSYNGATVYWSAGSGAHALTGQIGSRYAQDSLVAPSLGFPLTDTYDAGNGITAANFQSGQMTWSAATGARMVYGAIGSEYAGMGSTQSPLGAAATDEVGGAVAGSRVNRFVGGTIVWSPATGANAVYGAIGGKYAALGNEGGVLGLPRTSEVSGAAGARYNAFNGGTIIWSSTTGANAVYGAIYGTYNALGREYSALGKPTTDEQNALNGGRYNRFEGGTIIWSGATGAHAVYGAIYGDYNALGREGSPLGKPKTDEFTGLTGARVNSFEGGTIIWSPATGAHAVYGAIYGEFANLQWENGALGKPTTDEYAGANGARVNKFENGMIVWKYATGAHAVTGVMLQEFAKRGYEGGSLGAPITDAYPVTGGQEQKFENGTLTYVNGSFDAPAPTPTPTPTTAPAPAPAPTTAPPAPTTTTTTLQSSPDAVGNDYYWGSCVYWAYNRRVELGAPVSSYWGSGGAWASAARADGYTVDHKPQVGAVISTYGYGADPVYGHAMVVESINADGSFTISQMNAPVAGQVTYRTFTAADAANLWFIH